MEDDYARRLGDAGGRASLEARAQKTCRQSLGATTLPTVTLTKETWVDTDGRSWLRGIPNGVPAAQASIGVPLGPPSLEDLGLPKEVEVRLHNQLFQRSILTEADARARLTEIDAALRAALRIDVNRILAVYQGAGAEHAS